MPSLEKRVAHERDTLMERGPGIRLYAKRLRTRLRDPAVLFAAFLAGMLIARRATFLRTLPELTARSGQLVEALGKLNAIIKLLDSLLTVGLPSSGAEGEDTGNLLSGPPLDDPGRRPPPT